MKFVKSAQNASDFINDNKKEICFIGRSNVGKSSLINAIGNNKNLAKTSSTPGRTQLINYFDDDDYRLVDLPGYGFAKVSKNKQKKLQKIIETYIVESKNLHAIFQICDANVITTLDAQMSYYFNKNIDKHYVILNKIDRNNISTYKNNIDKIAEYLDVPKENIILVSAKNKTNIDLLKKMIWNTCYEK